MVLITEIVVLIERDFVDRRVLEIVRYGLVRCDDDATDDRRGAGDRKQCGIGPWASELPGCRGRHRLLADKPLELLREDPVVSVRLRHDRQRGDVWRWVAVLLLGRPRAIMGFA